MRVYKTRGKSARLRGPQHWSAKLVGLTFVSGNYQREFGYDQSRLRSFATNKQREGERLDEATSGHNTSQCAAPCSAADSVDNNISFDSVDKPLLICKFLLFTVNSYVFRHLYQSHHQAKLLHTMTHTQQHLYHII
jgi:hypothetical protein